jgi:hypothetical protein
MAAKGKKRKKRSALAGIVTGLAAAATEGVVRSAARRFGASAAGEARPAANDDGDHDLAARTKGKKSKAGKRGSKKKARAASGDAGVELLTALATKARKRLAKLADKLDSVTEKRNALIGELVTLQDGIAAALRRFETGREIAAEPHETRSARKERKLAKRRRRRASPPVHPDAEPSTGPAGLDTDPDELG